MKSPLLHRHKHRLTLSLWNVWRAARRVKRALNEEKMVTTGYTGRIKKGHGLVGTKL